MPARAPIAAESSTPPLAGPPRPRRCSCRAPGRPFDPNRDVRRLRSEGVRYVLVTGAVADRVLAARDALPARGALLRRNCGAHAIRLYYVRPAHGLAGPWVARLPAVMKKLTLVSLPLLAVVALVASGCGGDTAASSKAAAARAPRPPARRPGAGLAAAREPDPRARLLPRRWLPDPLDRRDRRHRGTTSTPVDARTGSYLIGFVWQETRRARVHVNLRGYPGRTTVPTCRDERLRRRQGARHVVPCFADPAGTKTDRRDHRDRLHGQPGRRPVARPLRVALRGGALHAQRARRAAAHLRRRSSSEPRPACCAALVLLSRAAA